MEVKGINNNTSSLKGNIVKNDMLDKNAFLKLLSVQLSNQDPLNPQDNTQYIAQMAQFASLEQSQNISVAMEKMVLSQMISEGSMLVGKDVTFSADNMIIKETVKGMVVDKGNVYLKTASGYYSIGSVLGVGDLENDKQNTESQKPAAE